MKVKGKALIKLLDKMHKHKTMPSFCLKCKKSTENTNVSISKTSNGKKNTIIKMCCMWY